MNLNPGAAWLNWVLDRIPYNLIGSHAPESSSKVEYEVVKELSQGLAGIVC